ncbi:MAG: chemotaxis protein CheB [Planctomycetota bacterium]|nr:chemotaxis protein CheB [Planctomycetota bacterium]
MKVLLVDDSTVIHTYIHHLLQAESDFDPLEIATDGAQAIEKAKSVRPDVILMDIKLPVLDGISAITAIMQESPCPIVVFSGHIQRHGLNRSFDALRAGAVEVLEKPMGLSPDKIADFRQKLLKTLRLMSKACVVRRRPVRPSQRRISGDEGKLIVAIGSSTGGPAVLYKILSDIPKPFPLPILICQHTIPGFEQGLAEWLSRTGHSVTVAKQDEMILPGHVYLSTASGHLTLLATRCVIVEEGKHHPTPNIDLFFESICKVYGKQVVALQLTGMGKDGAQGLLALSEAGALTMAQSAETCVVNGMPEVARRLGAVQINATPEEMGKKLSEVAKEVLAKESSSS